MNKIPIAEEYLHEYKKSIGVRLISNMSPRQIADYARAFAQFHIEAALKAASKVELDDISLMPEGNDFEESREKAILNAYSENLIV